MGLPHSETPAGCPSTLDLQTSLRILSTKGAGIRGSYKPELQAGILAPGSAAAWRALDLVRQAQSSLNLPWFKSPIKQWPSGEKRAKWLHE